MEMNVGIHQIDSNKHLIGFFCLKSSEIHGFQKHLQLFAQCILFWQKILPSRSAGLLF